MTDATITKSLYIDAAPEKVWDYLTQAEALSTWFHRPEGNLAEGAPFSMPGEDGAPLCWGAVEVADAPRRLSYSFTARPMNGLMTQVQWTLTPVGSGTRLELTHSGLTGAGDGFSLLVAFDAGWDRHLAGMRTAMG